MTLSTSPQRARRAVLSAVLGAVCVGALLTAGPAFASGSPAQSGPGVAISATSIVNQGYCDSKPTPPECGPHPECPDGGAPLPGPDPCPAPEPFCPDGQPPLQDVPDPCDEPEYVCPDGSQPVPGPDPCPTTKPTPPPTAIIQPRPTNPRPTVIVQPANPDFVIVRPSFTG